MITRYLKRVLILLCLGVSILMDQVHAQTKNVLLKEALKEVTRVYGTQFVYNPPVLEGKVTAYKVVTKDKPLEDVLKGILYPNDLVFLYIKNNYYSIVSKDKITETKMDSIAPSAPDVNASSVTGTEKQMVVSGTVKDDKGNVLPMITVGEVGTKNATMTSDEGKFRMPLRGSDATLAFSSIGFKSKKVSVDNKSVLEVVLESTESSLNEVTVVGYGTMRKKDLTGASAAINGKDIRMSPVTSLAEAMTGKMAGVSVTTTDGAPGADVIVHVRGGTSISQDNAPLYIVDGFPSDDAINQLSPQDIERIDVLKDASATAIYGSRGANGVILITTRHGKEGNVAVTYDGYAGIKKFGRKLDVLNPYDYAVYQYERTRGVSSSEDTFLQSYGSWDSLDSTYKGQKGINWQDEVYGRDAPQQSHSLAVSGGNKTTQYRLSYTREDQEGIMVNTDFTRNYFKFNLDQQVTDKLRMSANVIYTESTTNGIQDKGTLKNAIMYRPTYGLKGSQDSLLDLEYDPDISVTNPVTNTTAQSRAKYNKNMVGNLSLDYALAKGLSLRLLGGMNKNTYRQESFDNSQSGDAKTKGGPFGAIILTDASKVNNTALLNYVTTINGKHEINAMLGQEYVENNSKVVGASAYDYDNDDIGLNNLSLGNVAGIPTSDVESDKLLSFFGRVFYSYDHKYLLTATFRADGSSKFVEANRWGYFPSAAFSWVASEEDFIKKMNLFSNLKLRLSYGVSGNNRISNDAYSSTFGASAYAADGSSLNVALIPNNIANPDLKWESTYAKNLGVDLGFLHDRLTLSVDMYYNSTKDLLLNTQIPGSSGYTTEYKNIGSTLNKGIEAMLTTVNIQKPNFNWTSSFNITFSKNIVTSLNKELTSTQNYFLQSSNFASGVSDFMVKVGEPIGLIYGFVSDGYYGVDDFNYDATTKTYTLKPGQPALTGAAPQPGDMRFKDLGGAKDAAGNPVITDDDDRTIIGRTQPKFYGGFNNTFTYKNFDLSVFVNFSVGNDILNASKIVYTTAYYNYQNVLGVVKDRWRTVNDQGQVVTDPDELRSLNANAKLWKWQGGIPKQNYSWAVEDGSFLRINNITMGYTLPKSISSKAHIKSVRVYGTIYNVFTLTKYTGFDPEVSTQRSSPFTPGVDYSAYPRGFSAIGGLNIIF